MRTPGEREDPERALHDEFAFHIDGRAAELEAGGMAPDEARRQALAEFGDLARALRACGAEDRRLRRRRRLREAVGAAADDARAALRAVLRRPGAVAAPMAILALGIALNAMTYSVVRGVLLAPLPLVDAHRVHVAEEEATGGGLSRASYPVLEAWRRGAGTVEAVAAYLENDFVVGLDGAPRHMRGASVTEGYFRLLDDPILLGRAPGPEEHLPGVPPSVLVSEGLWEEGWGRSSDVLGSTLRLDGRAFRVLGVVRDGSVFPEGARLWVPLEAVAPGVMPVAGAKILVALARLRPGVGAAQAAEELGHVAASVEGGAPSAALTPLAQRLVGDVRVPLLLLQGAVLLVLLAACANAGGMLLARSVARRSELALRAALGAGRGRVMRTLLVEGAAVGAGAGVAGLVLAAVLLGPVLRLLPGDLPRTSGVGLDLPLAALAMAAALGTGVVTALVPALDGGRVSPARLLRGSTAGAGVPPWLRSSLDGLVVGQVALAMVLTVGAGLLVRSFVATVREDPGFDAARVTVMDLSLTPTPYQDADRREAFARTLLERAAALPGVEAVALARNLPVSGSNMTSPLLVEGSAAPTPAVQVASVSAGYFGVLGIPLLDGEGFADDPASSATPVLVVGPQIRTAEGEALGLGRRAHSFFGAQRPREVVGVAGPVRHAGLREAPVPIAYEPFFQGEVPEGFSLLVRSDAPPALVAREVAALVRALEPELAADRVTTMAARLGRSVAAPRFYAVGLSLFGGLALLLAVAGCQAALAHRTEARRRELGIRRVLGASSSAVRGMVVRRGVALTALGALLGLCAAVPLATLLRSQLFGVGPWDPLTHLGALVLLLAAAAASADLPARRAARVDPNETLREG